MTIRIGDIVGGHRVLELAGSGGMGTVYKTEHLITRRVEAMKVLPIGIGTGDDEIARFEREIQAQARLQHPNIAALYGATREENAMALIMEFVEGESLANLLERGRLPLDLAGRYARQVLDALAYAHKYGVIHCDVSPANIRITPDGAVKLTDFGLARAAADLGVSNNGVAMGSPWQMAPEQVRGTDPLDARTDVYALGSVLYEMVTGRKLFDVEGVFEILRAHLDTAPLAPSVYRPEIPAALEAVLARALAKEPAYRYQTAGEFLLELDSALDVPARRAQRRRAVMRYIWIAACMASIVGAAVLKTQSPWRDPEPRPVLPALEVPRPSIPPAPLPRSIAPAPVRVKPPVRQASAPASPAVDPAPRLEPRAVLQTAAADAADAADEDAPPAVEEPKRPTGNRFVRTLGKLNPFRKSPKNDASENKR